MFCPNCGKELKNGATFCRECGEQLNPVVVAEQKKKDGKLSVFIAKILVLLALLCFFMPFASVSCSEDTYKIDVKGTDVIFGNEKISDKKEGMGGNRIIFNVFVCVAAVAGVAAFLPIKKTALFSGISAISLIVFRATATSYYKIGERTLKEASSYITVKFGPALYIAIALFILAMFYALAESSAKKSKPPS